MGNALAFLEESKTKIRRGHHNRVCNEKIDAFVEENGTLHIEDCTLIKIGMAHPGGRVNEKANYVSSLPGINARRFAARRSGLCDACGELFTPQKITLNSATAKARGGDRDYTIWCEACRHMETSQRKVLKKIGDRDTYNSLRGKMMNGNHFKKVKDLYTIEEQKDIRMKLEIDIADGVLIAEERIIVQAYAEHEMFVLRESHYEFDF